MLEYLYDIDPSQDKEKKYGLEIYKRMYLVELLLFINKKYRYDKKIVLI